MNHIRKEFLVSRIMSGTIRLNLNNGIFVVRHPSPDIKYEATELYFNAYEEALADGLYSEDGLLCFLLNNGLWDDADEERLTGLEKDLEELKTKLCTLVFQSNEKAKVKQAIKLAKYAQHELLQRKHVYDYLGADGYAAIVKNKYVAGRTLYTGNGELVFPTSASYFTYSGPLIEDAIHYIATNTIAEADFREIARTEPWRSYWTCRKATGQVFPCTSIELSDEQKVLCVWTTIYDNIYESPECPDDEIIEDDDALDGWMILQKRKRDGGKAQHKADSLLKNPKIRGAQEIYLMANTVEDAKAIDDLNDPGAKATKRKREALLKKKGVVHELEMPDTSQRLQQEITKRFKGNVKGG